MPSEGDRPERDVAAGVFAGEVRYIVCRDVSGVDCDRAMTVDAPDCGITSHVRIVAVGESLGEAQFRSRRRPTLVVQEDYDLVDLDRGDVVEFDPDTFDPDEVWVATMVQQRFTAYHRVSADEAISNVRLVLALAAQAGNHDQASTGVHRFWWRGYTVRVTPNLAAADRYTTTHYERTPHMVVDGVPSRLRRAKRGRIKGPIPTDLEVGVRQRGP